MTPIHLGSDVLLENSSSLSGARVAVLTNYAGTTRRGIRTIDALSEIAEVVRVFAPEHGFWGDIAYLEDVNGEEYHGVKVESLYATKWAGALAPSFAQLRDVDALICDLQDVGARYYTYAATLGNCMAVAAQTGTRVIVLDRPNPINGRDVEGNAIFARPFMSFVGQYPLPIRHGLTIGEMALFINQMQLPACDLQVVAMRGWKRSMWWDETGLDWTHPSPNIATPDTALVYPGTCLFEGTNLSEGRGTTHPFEIIGAPWLDEERLASTLNGLGLDGIDFQPFCFKPTFNKHVGERCHGVAMRITNRDEFRPVRTAMLMLKLMRDLAPSQFAWHETFYEFATVPAIDALTGSSDFREIVDKGTVAELEQWIAETEERRHLIEPARREAMMPEYDETPRLIEAPTPSRRITDVPAVLDIPRAEA